jgi:mRNA (guanine-N7-)-methyltransferase
LDTRDEAISLWTLQEVKEAILISGREPKLSTWCSLVRQILLQTLDSRFLGNCRSSRLTPSLQSILWTVVFLDVAEKSVQDALERYNDSLKKGGRQQMRFSAHWIAVDCCQPSLQRELDRVDFFDIVSCQFSIHYAFESTERTRTFISNVAFKLRPGGLFIGTTPHAETLLRHSQASADLRSFKNDICSFVFDRPMEKIENGQRYIFTLTDAIADVAEYVVDPKVFTDICAEFDLELVSMENLQQVYEREIRSRRFGKLADEQHIPLKSKNLKPETWETFGLYMAYVFRKKGTPDSTKHRVRFDLKRAELTDIAKP